MFDQTLPLKAMEDSQWRRDTALGRKVASNLTLESCVKEPGDFIDWGDFDESRYCSMCGGFTTRSRVCKECLEEMLG